MRIVIATTGSAGDVQPFISLGIRLLQEGHRVRVAAPENARLLCKQCGLEFTAIDSDTQSRLRTETHHVRMDTGNSLRFAFHRIKSRRSIAINVNRSVWLACQDADLILYRIGGFIYADSIAEKLRIPSIKIGLVPYSPTKKFPSLYVSPLMELGSIGNLGSYRIATIVIWIFMHQVVNDFRQKVLGLQPFPSWKGPPRSFLNQPGGNETPLLYAFSEELLPKPADWGANIHVTGHWTHPIDGEWIPSAELLNFLDRGDPPVYLGFGSMINQDAQETYQMIHQALKICGKRGIISAGWSEMEKVSESDDLFLLKTNTPHEWLFPQTCATVHHGGIGTTLNSLKAGVPSIIVPFNYDQPFWGRQVYRIGAGPKPIPKQKLSAENLALAIQSSVEDKKMMKTVITIRNKMDLEDGTGYSIRVIKEFMSAI